MNPYDRIVTTAQGRFRGVPAGNPTQTIFRGIPFAKPPVGARRWLSAEPAEPFEGVRDCSRFAPICPQRTSFGDDPVAGLMPGKADHGKAFRPVEWEQNEDCLYLNVWTPDIEGKAPVMCYIHGGGYTNGSSYAVDLDGEALCSRGVVVVTMAYRVGGLGFFSHPQISAENGGRSGNQAISDVVCALEWVQKYISAFGGDPDCVTIFGQSAGGDMTNRLLCSPRSKGLFHRAVVHSAGSVHTIEPEPTLAEAEAIGVRVCEHLGMTVDELRALPAIEAYSRVSAAGWQLGVGLRLLSPVIDGDYICRPTVEVLCAGEEHDVDIMHGATLGDTNLFSYGYEFNSPDGIRHRLESDCGARLPEALTLLGADPEESERRRLYVNRYCNGSLMAMNEIRRGRKPMRIFSFERLMPGDDAGAYHAADLLYVFGTLDRCWRSAAPNGFIDADYALSRAMVSYWAQFAKTGDPNLPGLPAWPACENDGETMIFDETGPHAMRYPGGELTRQMIDIYFDALKART